MQELRSVHGKQLTINIDLFRSSKRRAINTYTVSSNNNVEKKTAFNFIEMHSLQINNVSKLLQLH